MIDSIAEYYERHPEILAHFAPNIVTDRSFTKPGLAILAVCQTSLVEPWKLGGTDFKRNPVNQKKEEYQFTFVHPDKETTQVIPHLNDFLETLIPLCKLALVIPDNLNLWIAPPPMQESLNQVLSTRGFHPHQSTFRFESYRDPDQHVRYHMGRLIFETKVTKL